MSKNICQHSKQAVVALKANLMTNPSLKTTKRLKLELKIQPKKKTQASTQNKQQAKPRRQKKKEIIENNSGHKRQFHDKPIIEKPQKDSNKAHPRRQKRVVIVVVEVDMRRRPWGPIMVATQW